jgi:hypothetical protein
LLLIAARRGGHRKRHTRSALMKLPGDDQPGVLLMGCSLLHIATSDLDVAIVGQLSPSNLPLCDEFEADPVKMAGFEAAFGRRGLWKQDLENAPGNAHHTLILAHPDAELDDGAPVIPSGVRRKAEKHRPAGMFY